jgi:hypothetical protein
MASNHSATLCFPDALLHGSDLLHWQTLRCLSGLGLLHPENPSSADLLFGVSQFFVSLPWVIKGTSRPVVSRPALRRLPVSSAFPGSSKERLILFKSSRQGTSLLTLLHPLLGGLVRGVDDMKKVYASGVSRHSASFWVLFGSNQGRWHMALTVLELYGWALDTSDRHGQACRLVGSRAVPPMGDLIGPPAVVPAIFYTIT